MTWSTNPCIYNWNNCFTRHVHLYCCARHTNISWPVLFICLFLNAICSTLSCFNDLAMGPNIQHEKHRPQGAFIKYSAETSLAHLSVSSGRQSILWVGITSSSYFFFYFSTNKCLKNEWVSTCTCWRLNNYLLEVRKCNRVPGTGKCLH